MGHIYWWLAGRGLAADRVQLSVHVSDCETGCEPEVAEDEGKMWVLNDDHEWL